MGNDLYGSHRTARRNGRPPPTRAADQLRDVGPRGGDRRRRRRAIGRLGRVRRAAGARGRGRRILHRGRQRPERPVRSREEPGHRLPRRIPVPLRGGERVPFVDRAARPDEPPRGPRVLHDRGPGDYEGYPGRAGRRRPTDAPAADRDSARGAGRRPFLPRRRPPQPGAPPVARPVGGLRRPRHSRGRNVYLRRPPLGGKSGAVPARGEVRHDRRPRSLPRRCARVNVYESILERRRKGPLHMTLLDPDKQAPAEAAALSSEAAAVGTDAIMVGGSTGVTQNQVDATVLAIKEAAKVPVILFPASAANLSPQADALYFMSLLNSRDPRLIIGEQRLAAPVVRAWGLETIPMAYLVVEPGMRAGEVGDAELISRKNPTVAVQYALAAQLLGMKLVYLEAGSGAPEPVPDRLIHAVREAIEIPLVVGGGIRTPGAAKAAIRAGADIVVTGTIVEVAREGDALRRIIETVKAG